MEQSDRQSRLKGGLQKKRISRGVALCVALSLRLGAMEAATAQPRTAPDSLDIAAQNALRASCADTATANLFNALAARNLASEPERALEYAAFARGLAETNGFLDGIAESLFLSGSAHYKRGYYDRALYDSFSALRIFAERRNEQGQARALNAIGLVYAAQERYDAALEYYAYALSAFETAADKRRKAYVLNNIGEAYRYKGKNDEALRYFQESLTLSERIGDTTRKWSSLNNIGLIYAAQGKHDLALQYYFEALRLLERRQDRQGQAEALAWIGLSYRGLGDNEQAMAFAFRALRVADSAGARAQKQEAFKSLSDLYALAGDSAAAFRFFRQYIALRDSMISEEAFRSLAYWREQYESERKERRIELLTNDMALQKLWRNSLLGGAFLLAAILGVTANRYRLKKRANQEIVRHQALVMAQAMELHRANTDLRRSVEDLESLNREKNEILGVAAHSLRNPLTSIVLAAGVVKNHYDQIAPQKLHKRLGDIERTALRMRDTVSHLLDLSMIESGNLSLSVETVDANALAQEITHDYNDWAGAKRITLQTRLPVGGAFVRADGGRLYEVLENLLSNAIKYSPKGTTVTIALETEPGAIAAYQNRVGLPPADGATVLLVTQDEGPGLTDDDKTRLFGKFARLSAQPTGGEHSSGLGLSIVKKLVEAMRGRVWCESAFGNGASFVVELPAAPKPLPPAGSS